MTYKRIKYLDQNISYKGNYTGKFLLSKDIILSISFDISNFLNSEHLYLKSANNDDILSDNCLVEVIRLNSNKKLFISKGDLACSLNECYCFMLSSSLCDFKINPLSFMLELEEKVCLSIKSYIQKKSNNYLYKTILMSIAISFLISLLLIFSVDKVFNIVFLLWIGFPLIIVIFSLILEFIQFVIPMLKKG